MSDWDFNYTHLGCEFCTSREGHIHRFRQANGDEFAHVDCYNRAHEKRATEAMERERFIRAAELREQK